ncbi:MAG: DUF3343 domain-containing protein [Clostridiales bacterium]|jgi:hypothetical protein|nr:DUF3343 domain-containing protein [Clostridiales bacterium]HOB64850.1 DUF3343 domain-containing protein [Clostridia bacterium]HOK81318.1 DUF3343 domain-containing protein [Clostridia bacterium]HOL60437.1 DUF3343 domain-containing protein [Clostridia bacterium]HPO53194.1 DUF3343 domain-containing protein [Clostridia bacterium]
MNTLAPFRSRSEALRLQSALKEHRVAAAVINTPSYMGQSCGLSVTFPHEYQALAKSLIDKYRLASFAGFFPR